MPLLLNELQRERRALASTAKEVRVLTEQLERQEAALRTQEARLEALRLERRPPPSGRKGAAPR